MSDLLPIIFSKILIQTTDPLVRLPLVFQTPSVVSFSTINGILNITQVKTQALVQTVATETLNISISEKLEKHPSTVKPNSRYFFRSVITKTKSSIVVPALYLVNDAAISPLKVISTKTNLILSSTTPIRIAIYFPTHGLI